MTTDEILQALNDNAHLGCSGWRYYRYGRQFYCGQLMLSPEDAEAAARRYAEPQTDAQDQQQS